MPAKNRWWEGLGHKGAAVSLSQLTMLLPLGFSVCLAGYNFTESSFGSLSYHRTVEAFKFAYGQRLRLGDPAFNETINEVRVGVVAMGC